MFLYQNLGRCWIDTGKIAKDTTGAEGFVAGAEDWGALSGSFLGHCVTHGATDCFKGIKQEPLDVTPYNGKAEYCRIISLDC